MSGGHIYEIRNWMYIHRGDDGSVTRKFLDGVEIFMQHATNLPITIESATIFAYGQTSSGKTFTMRRVTEKVVNDIYNHIVKTLQRDFTIKMSCLEIYNENVRDLLNSDSRRALKLLDDLEKGTVVDKLVEETSNSDQHLRHLISICEAQRQVGETALNDTSSWSHQIMS